jgi:UTP-glucose-1-phosphate uridylyltransferase
VRDQVGEIQVADVTNIYAQKGMANSVRLDGNRFDCGFVEGFISAIMHQIEQNNTRVI